MIKTWPYFEKLHTIDLSGYYGENFNEIAQCIQLCSKIKEFYIRQLDFTDYDLIKTVSCLKNLEYLCVTGMREGVPSNTFFQHISSNLPKLKQLFLSNLQSISEIGLESICKMEKLEELYIFHERFSSGLGIDRLSKIKKLCFCGWINLEDAYLISLLFKCADSIKYLDIRNCPKITNSVINVAIEITKKRVNNNLLKILIKGSSINVDKIRDKSPLLHLYDK